LTVFEAAGFCCLFSFLNTPGGKLPMAGQTHEPAQIASLGALPGLK
jgi:hypothetical protein